jgi:hypothetical protein
MVPSNSLPEAESPARDVHVYTLSEDLFRKVADLGKDGPYRIAWKNGMDANPVSGGLILVDTGTVDIDLYRASKEGVFLLGKGESLLQRWRDFLDQKLFDDCSPEGFEDFLRWRMRPALERSSDWPGGVFEFFQQILASVLISEALLIAGGNRQKTAQILGISRTTLRNRMRNMEDGKK